DETFDRNWARTVLQRSRDHLRQAHRKAGKEEDFEVLKQFLDVGCELTAAAAGEQLGKSEGAIRMAVNRIRSDYRELIRREIGDTIGPDESVDEEMKYLIGCLSA
ncbi:MAG: sigma-70 family RNA polymerase sigma factor, partial [Verrucomicrobiota bacterium]